MLYYGDTLTTATRTVVQARKCWLDDYDTLDSNLTYLSVIRTSLLATVVH